MSTKSHIHSLNITSASYWLLISVVLCFMASQALAAGPHSESQDQVPLAQVKVDQSTAVDKLIQKFYPNSPIATSALRKALQDANPKIISGNPQQRVKAGTTLFVPDHAQVATSMLVAITASPTAKSLDSGPSASDPSVRKPWVRFP
jgi:hypothetical protein